MKMRRDLQSCWHFIGFFFELFPLFDNYKFFQIKAIIVNKEGKLLNDETLFLLFVMTDGQTESNVMSSLPRI